MMKAIYTILLLICSNAFMTFAWYGHLRLKSVKGFESKPLLYIILLSWGIAFFEYCFQVPANRLGFLGNGGPFSLIELKVIQEVISISVFMCFTLVFFQSENFKWNHLVSFALIILAVFFAFKK